MPELKMTPDFKQTFTRLLGDLPNITAVCRLLNISCGTISYTRSNDPEFDQAVRDALEEGHDMLEEEARRRAVEGVEKPVFFNGVQVGAVREYSDPLLMFLLKGCKPKKFNPGTQVKFDNNQEKVTMTFQLGGE